MPKKRGRPPKTPNPKTPDPPTSTINETQKQGLDLMDLDEEDLADIDGLSPKQAERMLRNLDAIRTKLQGKTVDSSVKDNWDKEGDGYAMFRLMRNLRKLQQPFRDLNNRKYSNIDKKEIMYREKLDTIQSILQQDPLNVH
ncbi:hypothetical protein RIF29_10921 [Crotalaria pallida]|uniref:Uncharacterized protein n=1 Tax=Crotalaria pallida TaxID=3830 RepID=A0AAN9FTC5_CROPI